MDDPTTTDLSKVLSSINRNLEKLAIAVEKHNELNERLNKCPRCQGDGKDYGGSRCVACAGLGVKQPRADRRASDVDDSSSERST